MKIIIVVVLALLAGWIALAAVNGEENCDVVANRYLHGSVRTGDDLEQKAKDRETLLGRCRVDVK